MVSILTAVRISSGCIVMIANIRYLWCLLFILLLCAIAQASDCDLCRQISMHFISAVTEKPLRRLVGGNTLWEEKNIGTYATSDIRFHEILESTCRTEDIECHELLDKLEPSLENWWNDVFKENQSKIHRLTGDVCISISELCCPLNHFGTTCTPCSPCSPGGYCDGNGTRAGSGNCTCLPGYTGPTCGKCDKNTYSDNDKGCHMCHASCSGCRGPNATDCIDCSPGWVKITSSDGIATCEDVDECLAHPCGANEYCVNSRGSYSCAKCQPPCESCTGLGKDQCTTCVKGFVMEDNQCVDVDECSLTNDLCTKEGEMCKNFEGGFSCVCKPGYYKKGGSCLRKSDAKSSKWNTKRGKSRIIWTVDFAKKFSIYLAALMLFVVFCKIFMNNLYMIALAVITLAIFLPYQSTMLDSVFSNQG